LQNGLVATRAALLGRDSADYRPAQMTYDLRRLRRKGFICRQSGSTRYELTPYGRHPSLFLVRLYQRVLRPGLAPAVEPPWKVDVPHPLRDKLQELDLVLERMLRAPRTPPKRTDQTTDHPSQNVTLFFTYLACEAG
jgi:hypothetical protein